MDPSFAAMEIAEEALASLRDLRAGPEKYALHTARRQYRYTVACTIFSAVVVEGCLRRFIAVRIWFNSREPERKVLRAMWGERANIHRMIRFARAFSFGDPELLKDIEELFRRRNRMVHAGAVKMTESERDDPKHGPIKSRGLSSDNLTDEDIEKAEWCVEVAQRVKAAVVAAGKDPQWRAFQP